MEPFRRVEPQAERRVQVVTLGNPFDLKLPVPVAELHPEALAELIHLSSKAALWLTPYGQPQVAVCCAPHAPGLLARVQRFGGLPVLPEVVVPALVSTSLSADLLADAAAQARLLALLDPDRPVHLARYVESAPADRVEAWLAEHGFELMGTSPGQSARSRLWNDKAYAHTMLFAARETLRPFRPQSLIAHTRAELPGVMRQLQQAGIAQVALKSAIGAGGAGVFFAETAATQTAESVAALLAPLADTQTLTDPPYLVEQLIPCAVSPTVDLFLQPDGQIVLGGAACQRLSGGKYYGGYAFSPAWLRQPWFRDTLELAEAVGRELVREGYRGPVNVDFVVTPTGRPYLIELNARRTAISDGWSVITQAFGSPFAMPYSVAEPVAGKRPGCALAAASPRALVLQDGTALTPERWFGLMVAGPQPHEHLEDELAVYLRELLALGEGTDLRPQLGELGCLPTSDGAA